MHLVGFGFEPVEEALDAVPFAGLPEGVEFLHGGVFGVTISVVDPFAFVVGEVFPGGFGVDAAFAAAAHEVALAFLSAVGLEGFDGAAGDGEGGVGDGFFEVDADDAAESAAFRAGTER